MMAGRTRRWTEGFETDSSVKLPKSWRNIEEESGYNHLNFTLNGKIFITAQDYDVHGSFFVM